MRIVFKLLMKLGIFVALVMLSATGMRRGVGLFSGGSGGAGTPGADGAAVTNEEEDLRGTVLKSAFRLVSGQATRGELSKELSEKLYGKRGDPSDMTELGIELVTPTGGSPVPLAGGNAAGSPPVGKPGDTPEPKSGENPAAGTVAGQTGTPPGAGGQSPAIKLPAMPELVSGKSKAALSQVWLRMKQYAAELSAIPVVFIGMMWVARARRRKQEAGFVPDYMAVMPESDSEKYTMKHRVHKITAEEFELLVAVVYQRQGYRISLPAALSSGKSSRFKLARKSERLLVQCHNFTNFHRVDAHLVRELHEAMADANVTGGLFVASCGYTWDARHFAKTKNIKLISGKTLDAVLTQARATPDEKLLEITPWIPKFMTKVEMTMPHCAECGAEMDEVKEGDGSVWLCNQRPECGGRRDARKYRKGMRVVPQGGGTGAETAVEPEPEAASVAPIQSDPAPKNQNPQQTQQVPKQSAEDKKACISPPPPSSEQRDRLPKTLVGPLKKPPGHKPAEGVARSVIPGRNRTFDFAKQSNAPLNVLAASPKAEPDAVEGRPAEKSADEGSTPPTAPARQGIQIPAAQPVTSNPASVAAAGTGTKQNWGLLSDVAAEFRRRGFRLEEAPLAKPKPAPVPARGAGGAPSTPQKRTGLR